MDSSMQKEVKKIKTKAAPGACCTAESKSPFNSQACPLRPMPGSEMKIQENPSRKQHSNLHTGSLISPASSCLACPSAGELYQLLQQRASGDTTGIHHHPQGDGRQRAPVCAHPDAFCAIWKAGLCTQPRLPPSCLPAVMHGSLGCMVTAHLVCSNADMQCKQSLIRTALRCSVELFPRCWSPVRCLPVLPTPGAVRCSTAGSFVCSGCCFIPT